MSADGSETIVSLIPNAMLRAGFLGAGTKPYVIAFTQSRVIFGRVTNDMLKQAVNRSRDGATSEGKGFFGKWGAQLNAYSELAEGFGRMTPEQLLAQDAGNFAVDRSAVTKVKLKVGAADAEGGDMSDRLVIKTKGKDYTIVLNAGIGIAKQALAAAGMLP